MDSQEGRPIKRIKEYEFIKVQVLEVLRNKGRVESIIIQTPPFVITFGRCEEKCIPISYQKNNKEISSVPDIFYRAASRIAFGIFFDKRQAR